MARKYVPVAELTPEELVKRRAEGKMRRRFKVPGTTVSLFGAPSKMPGPSWGMTAGLSCPGAVYEPKLAATGELVRAKCSGCYAHATPEKGRQPTMYAQKNVAPAFRARFKWAVLAVRKDDGREFVETMVPKIAAVCELFGENYFRVHDSGDLFSPAYTKAWIRVCRALPHINFWFPTSSWQLPWAALIAELHALPNVAVHPSAFHVGDEPPVVPGLGGGSSTAAEGYTCPSSHQDGFCRDCRACWGKEYRPIYRVHADLARAGVVRTGRPVRRAA